MKPENIIARIEEYINSIPKEDREIYDRAIAVKDPQKKDRIATFANALHEPILNLAVIIDELKQEDKNQYIKQSKGNSTLQRIKKINKYLNSKVVMREGLKRHGLKMIKCVLQMGIRGLCLMRF